MSSEKEILLSATNKANKRELSFEEAKDIVSKYPQSHRAHSLLAFLYTEGYLTIYLKLFSSLLTV